MAKDYAKFVPPKKRLSRKKSRHLGTIAAVTLIAVGCVLASYYIYDKKSFTNNMTALASRLVAYAHHRKDLHLAKNTSKGMAQDNLPAPVHFDFYNQLPAMQVVVEEAEDDAPVTVVRSHPAPTMTAAAAPASAAPAASPVATASTPDISNEAPPVVAKLANTTPAEVVIAPTPKHNIFNPDEVANMLASETAPAAQALPKPSSQPYFIQLGTFETLSAAKQLVSALSSVGFAAKIVKTHREDQILYGVQQGPFMTREMALATKQRLQRRGIAGVVRKAV